MSVLGIIIIILLYAFVLFGTWLGAGLVVYLLTMFFTHGKYGDKTLLVFIIWPVVVLYGLILLVKIKIQEKMKGEK